LILTLAQTSGSVLWLRSSFEPAGGLRALAGQEAPLMALDKNDLSTALSALEGARSRGESARALAPLAEAKRLRGEIDEAVRIAEEGLAGFPDHVGIRIVLARALTDAGRDGEARRAYQEVLDRDPSNLEAKAYLTPAERVAGSDEPEGAEASSDERAETRVGGLSEELLDLANLFSVRRPLDEASDDSDQLSGIATLTLAEIYARQGLFDRAIDVCEAVLERSPDDERARDRLDEYRRELAAIR
jgi:tetratricopeptide (TPR) repeat protein